MPTHGFSGLLAAISMAQIALSAICSNNWIFVCCYKPIGCAIPLSPLMKNFIHNHNVWALLWCPNIHFLNCDYYHNLSRQQPHPFPSMSSPSIAYVMQMILPRERCLANASFFPRSNIIECNFVKKLCDFWTRFWPPKKAHLIERHT